MTICDCCKNQGKICPTTGIEYGGGLELCAEHAEQFKIALGIVQTLFLVKPPGYKPTASERDSWIEKIIPQQV